MKQQKKGAPQLNSFLFFAAQKKALRTTAEIQNWWFVLCFFQSGTPRLSSNLHPIESNVKA
jgi:hypothetical protein